MIGKLRMFMLYRMLTNGSTKGAVTGKNRVWSRGHVIDAPAGEFAHLGASRVEPITVVPVETAKYDPRQESTAAQMPQAINATDGARTSAAEHGIDLATVVGTGAGGRITKGDVEAMIGQ